MMARLRSIWLIIALAGCATGSPVGGRVPINEAAYQPFAPPATPQEVPEVLSKNEQEQEAEPSQRPATSHQNDRDKIVELARSLLGKSVIRIHGKRYPNDCTGLIKAVFSELGIDLSTDGRRGDNGVKAIYRYAAAHGRTFESGRPIPGDLVFFRETYDLNRDGRVNDGLTHIGLVEAVQDDETVLVIHRVKRGVVRYRMNLERRNVHIDPKTGLTLNDYLRTPGASRRTRLTGQLFATYATLLSDKQNVASNTISGDVDPPASR